MMSEAEMGTEQTVWTIVNWPDWRWPQRSKVELTVASAAPEVVQGIELAAAKKGIVLERKETAESRQEQHRAA